MDLTASPNKILVFSVVGLVVVLWMLVWLFGPKPVKIQPTAPVDTLLTSLLQGSKKEKKEEKKVGEPVTAEWGRDPFGVPDQVEVAERPTRTAKPTRPRGKPGARKEHLRLSTILITGSNRLAVINDRVYAVGDEIGGEKISKITLDHVVLTDGSEERLLRVPQPETQITVESTGGK
jgi:hypothetical protein